MSSMSANTDTTSMSIDAIADDVVYFPPRDIADFVIHCADTDFHVHKFVLHHHSAYFRAYFQTLSPLSRCRHCGSATSSSNATEPCDHPTIAHCIHLPPVTKLVSGREVTANAFQLFLCHLYFASLFRYPPFLPTTDIDLNADPPPAVSLCFPAVPSFDWSAQTDLRTVDGAVEYDENLLALAHYLDCAQLMQQCEAMLLTQVEWADRTGKDMWIARECASFLLDGDRYGLQRWRAACIDSIAAAGDSILQDAVYQEAAETWDEALEAEVVDALSQRSEARIAQYNSMGEESSYEEDSGEYEEYSEDGYSEW